MAEIAFSFGVPALPDLVDPSVNYNLGVRFTSSDTLDCVGIDWYVPATAPTGNCKLSLWRVSDEAQLASKVVSFAGQGGTLVRTYFDTPVSVLAATEYTASVHTPNRYVATTSYSYPHTDGVLTAVTANGWLAFLTDPASGADTFPNIQSGNAGNYHVSPVLDEGGGAEEKTGADVGRLAEAYALLRSSSKADTGRLAEQVQALQVLVAQRPDTGRLAEAGTVVVALTGSDAGRGADTRLTLAAGLSGADSGRSTDARTATAVALDRTDSGRGTDARTTLAATVAATELAALADVGTLVATGLQMIAASDRGRFAELADVVVLGLDHGHIFDRSTVRSRTTDRTVTRSRVSVRGLD